MKRVVAISLAGVLGLMSVGAMAGDAPEKSERAMSADSAKDGHSPAAKSERGMDTSAGKPGESPNPKSERAMDPAKSEK